MSSEDAAVVEPVRPDDAGEVRRVEVDGHAFLNEEDLLGTFDSGQTAITSGSSRRLPPRRTCGKGSRCYDLVPDLFGLDVNGHALGG